MAGMTAAAEAERLDAGERGRNTLRVAGLVVNFAGNILMLHGAVLWFMGKASGVEMGIGIAVSCLCVAVLAIPERQGFD